jgi:hypothetical protein
MKKLIFLSAVLLSLASCRDATVAQFKSLGSKHKVTLYGADGKVLGTWTATGNVKNESESDGWYFEDGATGKLIEVTGTIIIEQQ